MLQREGCEGYMFRKIPRHASQKDKCVLTYGLASRNHTTTRTDMTSQKCVIFLHEKALAVVRPIVSRVLVVTLPVKRSNAWRTSQTCLSVCETVVSYGAIVQT